MTNTPQIQWDIISERKGYVPDGYRASGPAERTGADVTVEPGVSAASSVIPVRSVRVGRTRLRAQELFPVKLSIGDDHFFVESENLGIYAAGKTFQAAVEDFCEQLIDIYEHYKSLNARQVTGDANRLRRLYTQMFVEEQVDVSQA